MDSPLTSTETACAVKESSFSSNKYDGHLEGDLTEASRVIQNGTSGVISSASSSFDDNELEFPKDIPDGPQFRDLAAHIDLVVDSLSKTENPVESPLSLNGFVHVQPPPDGKPVMNSAEPLHVSSCSCYQNIASNDELEEKQSGLEHDVSSACFKSGTSENPVNTTDGAPESLWNTENGGSKDCPEAVQEPLFSDDIKPFAFFPTENSCGMNSDQWAWAETVQTASTLPANTDFLEPACLSIEGSDPSLDSRDSGTEGDEDFGEFESCQAAVSIEEISKAPCEISLPTELDISETNGILSRLLQHLEPALTKAFETSTPSVLNDWLEVSKASKSCNCSHDVKTEHVTTALTSLTLDGTTLWNKLFTHGRAHDLRQQWSKSILYDSYLRSVNIDVRNAMPAFASQLRLLEPIRLGSSNFQTSHTKHDEKTLSNAVPTSNSIVSSSKDQDPAGPEFDWNSSGLTNPLNAVVNSATVESLDLDYFEMQPEKKENNKSNSKNSEILDLERELFGIVSQPPDSNIHHVTQAVLNQAALQPHSSITNYTVRESKTSTFSSTVRAVLSKLPKLNYMRARNLIFPIPESGPS